MKSKSKQNQRSGAIIIFAAFSLFVMLIMAAIAIDVAYMQLVRTELRTATDAASIAGCEALGRFQSRTEAIQAAKAVAALNDVAKEPLLLADDDVQIGTSAPDASGLFVFTELPANVTDGSVNSVRVDGRRDETSLGGRVQLFMGGILDTEFFAPQQQATSTSSLRDIGLVLDRSGSMAGQKIQDLKDSIEVFFDLLEQLPPDSIRCSLTSYNAAPTLDVDLTSEFAVLSAASEAMVAGGNTNIGDSLRVGGTTLLPPAEGGSPSSRTFANKAIILLSDGVNTAGNPPFVAPAGFGQNSVEFCVANNIQVFTIGFGGDANVQEMTQIAADTGGFFRNANTGADLEQAFRDIAAQIAVLLVQ